jgi:hypothetical protein
LDLCSRIARNGWQQVQDRRGRAWAERAGYESTVTWSGTFGWTLLPGTAVGLLLGWAGIPAPHRRAAGPAVAGARAAAVRGVLVSDPGGLARFLEDGIGGGALAVPLFGMLALSTERG